MYNHNRHILNKVCIFSDDMLFFNFPLPPKKIAHPRHFSAKNYENQDIYFSISKTKQNIARLHHFSIFF